MACIARIILFRPKCCRQNAGIFASFYHLPISDINSFINSMHKGNTVELFPKRFCTSKVINPVANTTRDVKLSVFHKICFPQHSKLSEGTILNIFFRMDKIYDKFIQRKGFKDQMKAFVSTNEYKAFCKQVEAALPVISAAGLLIIYDIKKFSTEASEQLCDKICDQILLNFNNYSLSEKLHIYNKVLKHYSTHEMSNNIKKACQVYFENYFETDLLHQKFTSDLLMFLDFDTIPKGMKKIIAEKLLGDGLRRACSQIESAKLIKKFVKVDPDVRPKDELKEFIKICAIEFNSPPLIIKLSPSIRQLVHQDDFFMSKDVLDTLLFKAITRMQLPKFRIKVLEDLCLMGYLSEDMLESALDGFTIGTLTNSLMHQCISFVNVFVRCSIIDTQPAGIVQNVRDTFQSFNLEKRDYTFSELCTYCEGLTYLGCDTRSLCDLIFKNVIANYKSTISERNTLFLHHLAKACLRSGYQALPEHIVNRLLEAEVKSNGATDLENLNEYFDCEDYVLKNCVTSDKHLLHFVTLFGPDKKPIDLSAYKSKNLGTFIPIEIIQRPPGSKLIVFQKLNDPQPINFITRPIMSGAARMYLKVFESVHCRIILLPRKFFHLNSKKKKDFLTLQIGHQFIDPVVEIKE